MCSSVSSAVIRSYVPDFSALSAPEPESGLLEDHGRPLVFWQVEHAAAPLLTTKELGAGRGVILSLAVGACCDPVLGCMDDVTMEDCVAAGGGLPLHIGEPAGLT